MTARPARSRRQERLARYRPLLDPFAARRWGWVQIVAVTLAGTAVSLATPLPLAVLVDDVLGHHRAPALLGVLPGAGGRGGLLGWMVAAELLLFATGSALEVLVTVLWIRVGQGMVFAQAREIFGSLQRRSLLFHTRSSVGDNTSRVTEDSWVMHSLAEHAVMAPLHGLLTIIGVLAVMATLDIRLTVVVAVAVPASAAASVFFGARMRRAAIDRRGVESRMQSHVQQTLAGIPVVQAFVQEDRHGGAFRALAAAALNTQKRAAVAGSLNELASGLVGAAAAGVVVWVGAQQVVEGRLTLGVLVAFLAYLVMLQAQLVQFTGVRRALAEAGARVDRVLEVLGAEPEVVDGPLVFRRVKGRVAFEGVTFGYVPGRPVLSGVSFEVAPGEVVALVGSTGAGKSTVAGLVARLFDPQEGRVLIDGRDVRRCTVASVRSQVAMVLQDSFLFPVSVAANIAYGRPGASRAEVVAAAKAAQADEFIRALPEGYDTVVGERGATLSGGERQRLSIARALLKDAPVLILDEPTSSLDVSTEASLMAALRALMAGRTTLVIAHRLSTIRDADRIIVLDGGRIVECGTHDELVAQRRRYASMHRLQTLVTVDPERATGS